MARRRCGFALDKDCGPCSAVVLPQVTLPTAASRGIVTGQGGRDRAVANITNQRLDFLVPPLLCSLYS
jgi:hypothetical protein